MSKTTGTCILCNQTKNDFFTLHTLRGGYVCDSCDCGDYGVVTCGRCRKRLERCEAFLSIKYTYLCSECDEAVEEAKKMDYYGLTLEEWEKLGNEFARALNQFAAAYALDDEQMAALLESKAQIYRLPTAKR